MPRWESLGADFGGFTLHELVVGLAALPAGAKLVLGMKNVAEVESNLAAVRKAHTVPKELWREAQRMRRENLLRARGQTCQVGVANIPTIE